jgi:hypothetical protein
VGIWKRILWNFIRLGLMAPGLVMMRSSAGMRLVMSGGKSRLIGLGPSANQEGAKAGAREVKNVRAQNKVEVKAQEVKKVKAHNKVEVKIKLHQKDKVKIKIKAQEVKKMIGTKVIGKILLTGKARWKKWANNWALGKNRSSVNGTKNPTTNPLAKTARLGASHKRKTRPRGGNTTHTKTPLLPASKPNDRSLNPN